MSNGGDFGGENGFCVECACLMRKVKGSTPEFGFLKLFDFDFDFVLTKSKRSKKPVTSILTSFRLRLRFWLRFIL